MELGRQLGHTGVDVDLATQFQGRRDVVPHRHRGVVDELLIDHGHVALAHRRTGHVHVVGQHPAPGRNVQARHHPHQRCLAGLRRAQQHGDRLRHQRQVKRVQMGHGAHALLDAFEPQLHGVSGGVAATADGHAGTLPQWDRHQSATAWRSAEL